MKYLLLIFLTVSLTSCGENKVPTAVDVAVSEILNPSEITEVSDTRYSLPTNCTSFIQDILKSNDIIDRPGLVYDVIPGNNQTCKVKIHSDSSTDGEVTISINIEQDEELLPRQKMFFEASKKSKLLFPESRFIENIGDIAYYGNNKDYNVRTVKALKGNAVISISDKAASQKMNYLTNESEMTDIVTLILDALK